MKVYEAVAAAVAAEGCDAMFGLLGDANMPVWAALAALPSLRIVSARHEAGAVAMADGYARASGKIGLASVTSGPGLTQVGTSLTAAARNRTPLVVVAGDVPVADLNNVQRYDQRRFAHACEAEFVQVTNATNVVREVAEAFYIARTRRRPVVLDLPTDVQAQTLEWGFAYTPSSNFATPAPGAADGAHIDHLLERLLAAERPVIIGGLGVRLADAQAVVVQLADRTGALLATTIKGKGLFAGHPFDIGIAGAFASSPTERLLAEADFVLGVGAELGFYTTEGGLLFPDAAVARIDHAESPTELGVLPGHYVRGDAKATVTAMLERLDQQTIDARVGFRSKVTVDLLSAPQSRTWPVPADGMDPRALAVALAHCLPRDAIVTVGAGHFWSFFLMYAPIAPTLDLQLSYQFGAIGQTIPLAAGVGMALAGRPHLVIEGDGSLMMNLQELESMARQSIPAVVMVWNDRGFGAEVHKLKAKGWSEDLGRWSPSPDFVALAKAFGGDGARVERVEEVASAMQRGFGSGGLFVIDARVSPSIVSDPYRKVQFGEENTAPLLRFEEHSR